MIDRKLGSERHRGAERGAVRATRRRSDQEFPGYALPEGTDLNDLSQQILAAMKERRSDNDTDKQASKGSGKVRIDGGVLAFAVIGQATPATPAGQ